MAAHAPSPSLSESRGCLKFGTSAKITRPCALMQVNNDGDADANLAIDAGESSREMTKPAGAEPALHVVRRPLAHPVDHRLPTAGALWQPHTRRSE